MACTKCNLETLGGDLFYTHWIYIFTSKGKGVIMNYNKYKGLTTKNPLYLRWYNIKRRCNNPTHHAYKDYGGRGIKLCEDWLDFISFYNWAIIGYKKGLTIDRIDNDGDYCPGNCRWTTQKEQTRNTRHCKLKHEDIARIKSLKGIISGTKLAEEYNVHREHIYAIQRGIYWN